ncbi:hypothetical protein KQX54_009291 [Cotesia glomerata]|uniref:Uncharacterized protein n=1 Tax=Cotesia glomerata TaxID=32391 RepID=A0AAV7I3W1_COTGL|nr:hypothetical protein KQX54_009291 [Cotesia glomerata]
MECSLILKQLVLQTKLQPSEDDESIPDMPAAIQEILAAIFSALYNHQDEEEQSAMEMKPKNLGQLASGNGSENGEGMGFNQEIYRNIDFAYIETV